MNPDRLKQFGNKIRELRVIAKMTGSELAERVNSTREGRAHVSKSYISDIELGRRQPREEITRELARVLGGDERELVLLSGRIPEGMDINKAMEADDVSRVRRNTAGKGNGRTQRHGNRSGRKKSRI